MAGVDLFYNIFSLSNSIIISKNCSYNLKETTIIKEVARTVYALLIEKTQVITLKRKRKRGGIFSYS